MSGMPMNVAEVMAREQAIDKTKKKIGMPSKRDFLNDKPYEFCVFCSQPLPKRMVRLLDVEIEAGTERCSCDQSQAYWSEYDRLYHEFFNTEMEYHRKKRVRDLVRDSKIPARWVSRTFEFFEVDEQNRKAYEKAKSYADSFDALTNSGLLFTGTVGTGKTHLSAAIAMELMEREYKVIFGTVTTLLAQIRSAYGESKENEQAVFNKLARCQLLIIDDLGKEKVTEWVDQTLYELVNTRYENNKPLIITSNMSLTEIRNKYENSGDAIVSRIIEMCRGIKMDGLDWRKKAMR